jgi:hypothetical protein
LPAETEASEEAEDTDQTFGEALFSYTQGDSDYNNEEALQYSFSPYDYVDSADEPVDISVSVSSTSAVQGGIGMLTSDGWTIYSTGSQGGEQVWTANNVDLSEVSGDIAVQLYYLKHNSTFEISSISITPSSEEATDEVTDEIAEEESSQDSQTETQPAETTAVTTEAPKETSTVTEESVAETTAVTTEEISEETTVSSVEDATQTEAVKQTVMAETTSADEEIPETDDSEAAETADTASTDSESSETAKTESNTESAAETTAQDVQQVVTEASGKADSNPDTGNGLGKYVCAGVMILCGAQMAYSIYALTRKNEN